MQERKVEFENASGESLAGLLTLPQGAPRAFALFAHCFTCSKNLKAARSIAHALVDAGVGVLRFDFTGLGQSDGEFAETNFSSNVEDLEAAAGFLEDRYAAPALLVGHSLGGTASLQAAAGLDAVVAVATIGSPAEPAHVKHLLKDAETELEKNGAADVELGGRTFRMKRQFLDDLEEHDLPEAISRLRKGLLFLHAPLDEVVDIDNASKLFSAAKHPKSFVSLDSADHLLSDEADAAYAGAVIAAWASRYLPADEADGDEPAEGVVAKTGESGFRTDLVVAGHALVADEPESVGGSGAGPSPYDLLSAALASCTTMTLRMYADHKKLDVSAIEARVTHGKIHAKDCEDCESEGGKIDEFERELAIDGDLDDAQRQRLLEIADRCPVHRTLEGEVKVRTRLG